MRLRTSIIAVIVTLGLFLSSMRTVVPSLLPAAKAAPAIAVEHLLNPDGTLRLDGTFSGALDVSGWQVTLDPQRGPIFQTLAGGAAQWTNLGSAINGALSDDYPVYALAVSGSDVYVGGLFTNAASIPEADYVARFDTVTNTWHALGSNGSGDGALNNQVRSLAVSDSEVYVVGQFTNAAGIAAADYVARWDGSSWYALGSDSSGNGALNDWVRALAVSGSDVYVGGWFTNAAGNLAADYVARWDGNTWHALGGSSALNNGVLALAASDSDVYVGGWFTNAAGIPEADRVARWDGNTWHALGGSGDGVLSSVVNALAVSGSNVYVGGGFTDAAGNPAADYVARFDTATTTWHALGSNGSGNGALNDTVSALTVSGSEVYVGGWFTDAAGIPAADYVARWDGSTWHALGGSGDGVLNRPVTALAMSGSEVYVGGFFTDAAGILTADHVARWDGSGWNPLGSSSNGALNSGVNALTVSGSEVYVGGWFTDAAGIPAADYVARWDGSGWHALGSNGSGNGALNSGVRTLAASDGNVYVGGFFTDAAGNLAADYVARWDGSRWHALGSNGSDNGALNSRVNALAVSGGDLYVGGAFTNAASFPEADYVARWDGSGWYALGGSGNGALNGSVNALTVSGGDVYVGGDFTDAAGIAEADYVARWDGSNWYALGSNGSGNGALNSRVNALAVSGSNVYAGGQFTNAASTPEADFVAQWDGSSWYALGGSGNGVLNNQVHALAVSGHDLYVGGEFNNVAGITKARYVARWDGSNWNALESSGNGALNSGVSALAVSGNDAYMSGLFTNAAGIPEADYVAAYAAPPSVDAITRINPNPTSAASVQFQVSFDEPVVGVDAADFALTTTGALSGASVTSVSGSGATYTVTVATGAGAGTLRLDIPASATISDLAGLRVNNLPFTTGESYLIPARIYVPLVQR